MNKSLIICFAVLIIADSFSGCNQTTSPPEENSTLVQDSVLNFRVYKVDDGWAYEIVHEGQIIIRQNYIPAIEGRKAFKDSLMAHKTASLIIHKIRKNIMPPSVSISELDSLGILQ